MKKLSLWILLMLCLTMSCKEEQVYDFDAQLSKDVLIIDNYLAVNGINHIRDDTGLRYVILKEGQGDTLKINQSANFEISIWILGGSFHGSTNPSIDLGNGGNNELVAIPHIARLTTGYRVSSVVQKYLCIIAPKMTEGDRFKLYVPSGYGYGYFLDPTIPWRPIAPNTNLIVEVEMTRIDWIQR